MQIKNIAQGFIKLALQALGAVKEQDRLKARERLEICDGCDSRNYMKCRICGCYLPAKALSDSGCPLDKW